MSTTLIRTRHCWYWLSPAGAVLLTGDAPSSPKPLTLSTAALLADLPAVEAAVSRARRFGRPVPVDSLDLVSPVQRPCRVLAAHGAYRPHPRPLPARLERTLERRRRPVRDPLSVVLRSPDALAAPGEPLRRPAHVRLLEQGVEVGLVVGRPVAAGTRLDDEQVHGLVGGLVLAGSVVARDVELETGHPVEATSYPSFTGLGAALVLVDRDELKRVVDLRLTVSVNGRVRQEVLVGDEQVSDPLDVLRAVTRFQGLDPGDLVLTGAPAGGAWLPGSRLDRAVDGLLEPSRAARRALRRESHNDGYLADGDVVEVRASTEDGALDLGSLSRVVVGA